MAVFSVLVIAKNYEIDTEKTIITDFKLEVMREGKLSEKVLLVRLIIWKFNNTEECSVSWSHVQIEPVHDRKKVCLSAHQFSTAEGSIKNVIVGKDRFSFRIEYAEGLALLADVVGKKIEGQGNYSVEVNAIVRLNANEKTTEKWQSTDKTIILPYKEVF